MGREREPDDAVTGAERSERHATSSPGAAPAFPLESLLRRGPDGRLAGAKTRADEQRMLVAMQRSAGNAAVNRLLREVAPPVAAPGAATGERALIVADEGPPPLPGQMRRSDFLDALEPAVCRAAEAALDSAAFQVASCPWIEHWIAHYRTRSAADVETAIARYAPAAARSATAAAYVEAICARVNEGIATWEATGELPAAPAGGPGPPPGEAQPASAVAFKLRDGVGPGQIDPADLQRRLGPGRPLEGAVGTAMGAALQADFSGVRVHDDPAAGALAGSLSARAFAVGGHVAFAPDEYAPGTPVGDGLIAHELAHVVQQGAAPAAGPTRAIGAASGLEADADAAAGGALEALYGSPAGARGLAPALRSGLRLQSCGATVPRPELDPSRPFDQPKLTVTAPPVADEVVPPLSMPEANSRMDLMEATLGRLARRHDKDKAVMTGVARARTGLGALRSGLSPATAAVTARRIHFGQRILEGIEENLVNLEKMRTQLAASPDAGEGRAGYLAAVDKAREAYVNALGESLGDKQVETYNAADALGAGLLSAFTEVDLALIEQPGKDYDADDDDHVFKDEVIEWVGWMRGELLSLKEDAQVVAEARRAKAPDLADREKLFAAKAELMSLSLRGLRHYDMAVRATFHLRGPKFPPGITDDLVVLLKRGRFMRAASFNGELDELRNRVATHEADPNVETFYRAVPLFKFGSDFAVSFGIMIVAAIATAGVGGLMTAAIGETATLGGAVLAGAGTAAVEALTFTLVSRGMQSSPHGTFLEDFGWNFGLFGLLKGGAGAIRRGSAAVGHPGAAGPLTMAASFPLMHFYGRIRFRYEQGRWPSDEEIDQMVGQELFMFLGLLVGTSWMKRWMPPRGKPSELQRFHSKYGWRFEGLELARTKVLEDYTALIEQGSAADPAKVELLKSKSKVVEDTFKDIVEEIAGDKSIKLDAIRAELKTLDKEAIEGSSELLAKELKVPEAVGLRPGGGDRSYTYHWGKTGQLSDGMRALGPQRVEVSPPDPVSGLKRITLTVRDGEPPLTFQERPSPFPAGKEVELDPAAPEVVKLAADLGVTDPAAGRELLRIVSIQLAKNPAHGVSSAVSGARKTIKDALKGPEAAGLDAEGYLKLRATTGAQALTAPPKLVEAAEKLEKGGLLKTEEWLEKREPGLFVGLVGEHLAAQEALASAAPGKSVLRSVHFAGDLFLDPAMTQPHTRGGRPSVGVDAAAELDLLTGEMTAAGFEYSNVANVKSGSSASLPEALAQNAEARAALTAHEKGVGFQRPDGKWARITKITAVDQQTGAVVDLTGKVKAGATVGEEAIGPAKAKGKDATAWSKRLPYTAAELDVIVRILREMQAMKAPGY